MTIGRNSRNNFAVVRRITTASGAVAEFDQLDMRNHLTKTDYRDNRTIQVRDEESWSRLAWRTLGNGRHWWIIADYSKVVDPFAEIVRRESLAFIDNPLADIAIAPLPSDTVRVLHPLRFRKGMLLEIEDMASGLKARAAVTLAQDDGTLKVASVSPRFDTSSPPPEGLWLRAATTRIMLVSTTEPIVTAPTTARAMFEAFDFRNPVVVAEE